MLFRAQTQSFKGAGTGPSHSLRLHRRTDSKKKKKKKRYRYEINFPEKVVLHPGSMEKDFDFLEAGLLALKSVSILVFVQLPTMLKKFLLMLPTAFDLFTSLFDIILSILLELHFHLL